MLVRRISARTGAEEFAARIAIRMEVEDPYSTVKIKLSSGIFTALPDFDKSALYATILDLRLGVMISFPGVLKLSL